MADRLCAPGLRRLALALLLLAPLLATVGATSSSAQDALVVTMVTDTAGLGDQNFNDAVKEGLDRAAADFGVEVRVLESLEAADYVPNLSEGAAQSDLTVGVGFLLAEAMGIVAQENPDRRFVLIDAKPLVGNAPQDLDNVISAEFREQEGGFLAGIVAGRTTKTGKVGVLGGMDIPPVERYEVGFRAGVQSVTPDVEVVVTYTGSFGDPALGKEQSLALYNQNADIVFAIAGATGIGTFEAAKEKGPGFFVVAADKDQSQLGAEQQLCVATKSLSAAVYEATRQVVEGGFEGGTLNVGLKENGTGLEAPGDKVPADVLAIVDQYRQAIIDGAFTIPATRAELEQFQPPVLGTPAAGTPAA